MAPPRLPSPPPPKPGMLRPESPGIWTPNCEVICWTAPMTSPGRSDTIAACTNSCWEGAGAAAWVMLVARAMANGLATASAATELKAVESRRRRRLGTEVSSISGRSLMVFCGFACAITGFPRGCRIGGSAPEPTYSMVTRVTGVTSGTKSNRELIATGSVSANLGPFVFPGPDVAVRGWWCRSSTLTARDRR
ncbi:Uncharacterised protein [Mycobacteroides abscessus subsp. abscessus]|nr:Uncharacterised protein [Mycobacteroides abscessus subsp. abscessus]